MSRPQPKPKSFSQARGPSGTLNAPHMEIES